VATALLLFLLEFGTALAIGIALVRLPAPDRRTHP
jgi:hypothetical protein